VEKKRIILRIFSDTATNVNSHIIINYIAAPSNEA